MILTTNGAMDVNRLLPLSCSLSLLAALSLAGFSQHWAVGAQAGQGAFVEFEQLVKVSVPGQPIRLVVSDDGYAYIAAGDGGIQIFDVRNPARPILVGAYATPGAAYAVAVAGDIMYIADYDAGLQIVDVSDRAHPGFLGAYDTPGIAWDVDVQHGVVYLTDLYAGLHIFDVHHPASPVLLNAGALATQASAGIEVVGNTVYAAGLAVALNILDVSDLSVPSLIGMHQSEEGEDDAWALDVVGGLAYIADGVHGLLVVDVKEPAQPKRLGALRSIGRFSAVAVQDQIAYGVDSEAASIVAIDVSTPALPLTMGAFPGLAFDVQAGQGVIYVAASDGLLILAVKIIPAYHEFFPRMLATALRQTS